MRISKKILAIALSILMAVSMMPFTVFAATTGVATGAELKAAIAAANDGDVIEFTADNTTYPATSGALVIPVDGKDITIDLNGHTQYFRVSGETTVSYPTDLFVLKNGAKLTVKDSVGGGAIYATYGANSAAYIFNVLDTSELVIDGGKFVMDAANYGGVIVYQNVATASTTINGGEFTANTGAKARRDYLINNTRGEVEINGGKFTTARDFDYVISEGNTTDTSLTINAGEFNGTMSLDTTKATTTLNGGTYKTYDGSAANTAVSAYLPADQIIDSTTGQIKNVDQSTVARTNSGEFTSLKDALDSVAAGATATITLLDDCTLPATYEIADNQKITINMNGNDITTSARAFNIRHGQLTLSGTGELNANFTGANAAVAVYGATTSSSSYSTFTQNSTVTINAPNGYGAMIGANGNASYGAKLQLNGTINSKYGVYVNGNIAEPEVKTNAAAVNITGTVTASNDNAVVYLAGYAKTNIYSNANLTGGSGVYIKSGTLTIYGNAAINAIGDKTDYVFNNNGCDPTGDAVIIDSCGYPGSVPTVTIKAGTITSANGAAVASYAKQDDPRYSDAEYPRVDNVVPGTSTAVFSSDVTALAAEGYETVYDSTAGGYVVAEDNHTVAKIGNDKYDSLNAAITAASTGDTIVLVKDTTLTTTDVAINKNLTIDFGEYTVTAARWPFINNATLTLNGTTGGIASARGVVDNYGTLIINGGVYGSTTVGTPTFWNNPDGVIVMNGGTINAVNAGIYNENATFTMNDGVINSESSSLTQGNKYSYAVRNLPGSTTTMNGGTINAVHGGIAAFGDGGSDITTVVINGGTITTHNSDAGNDAYYAIYVSGNGTSVTVNDGTFSSPRAAAMLDDDDIGLTENAALVITGGTFTSPSGVATVARGQNDSNPSISGGTFSSEVPAEFCADGYIPVANAGGTYGVEGGYVAAIGSTGYETLAAAFAAASDGDTIKIVADATGNGIAVPANTFGTTGLTVDFNGHKYTCNGNYAGSTGTQRQVFQLNQGNTITFMDGTIESTGARMLIQNYSDLTLDNMTLSHLGHTDFADKTPYALSNNNGTVVINDTTINACNDGFAFDACRYASYPSVSVTVTGDSAINGDVEVSASSNNPSNGLELNLNGGTMSGNIVLDDSAKTAMAEHPDKASVNKADSFSQAAPAGYKWVSNGDGTSSLVENTPEEPANGSSLALTDKIETTIYIDADAYDVDASEAVVKATYNHNAADTAPSVSTDTYALSELTQYSGQTEKYVGTYMFTYACAPAQLTEDCTVELYANAEAEEPVYSQTYSAKSYCDKVNAAYAAAENPDAALTKLNALCDSLVDYAKAAQFQFDYSKDLTDAYRNDEVQTLTAGDITATANVKTSDVAGFAFDCQDELNILVYTNSAVAPTGVSMNATKYADKINAAADSKDSTNFIRVKGLGSGNINKVVTVNTANGDITVSANAIVKAYLGSDAVSSNMKDLARAIYLYGAAAADYFGA